MAFLSAFYYENDAMKLSLILAIVFLLMHLVVYIKPYLKSNVMNFLLLSCRVSLGSVLI